MELIERFWQFIVAGIAMVVWLVRLEAKANANSRQIMESRATTNEDLRRLEERLIRQRQEDMATRQRDWERLLSELHDMRQDIKQLLQAR